MTLKLGLRINKLGLRNPNLISQKN